MKKLAVFLSIVLVGCSPHGRTKHELVKLRAALESGVTRDDLTRQMANVRAAAMQDSVSIVEINKLEDMINEQVRIFHSTQRTIKDYKCSESVQKLHKQL